MTPKQEEALRDYLQEVIVPLIEEVLVKKLGQAMTFAKKELAEQPAQQELVAWLDEYGNAFPLAAKQYSVVGKHWKPLYTSPPAQRKPLTDEQREEIAKGWRGRNWTVGDIIDAIEAAQGIGEKK